MTDRKLQSKVTRMVLGLAAGTSMMGVVAAQADTTCFGAVADLYMAQRASGTLDYLACKEACRELTADTRNACRTECRQERAAAVHGYRDDADALLTLCDGGGEPAQRAAAGAVSSTCVSNLSACATEARTSARFCDRNADAPGALADCAADVSAAVDGCAAAFVECVVPAEASDAE